ncbi:class I SAM-dependent methyltransferase [Leucothrix arctica]|uniref:Methyltransferase n=1 Tax=Leucothrix arctica TaxID=1481894 RepID=A0A317CEP5_9GAMM|nr:methyltransferase [Leucothrix arctica]PWQ94770.1 methyltransferase [Leucothrix arctica]
MASNEAYLNTLRKDILFSATLAGKEMKFSSTWGIFSPREIDAGTELILRYLKPAEDASIFDLGCGYGPIGLTLAKLAPKGDVLMADKDFMAVEYANKNATLNGITNAEAILCNGFQHVDKDRRFDLVVSNVPAKVGNEMMSLMLHDAYRHMNPGAKIYLVTVNGLRQYMKRNLKEVFGNYKKEKQGAAYTVQWAVKE